MDAVPGGGREGRPRSVAGRQGQSSGARPIRIRSETPSAIRSLP